MTAAPPEADPSRQSAAPRSALFALGFRPFFLAAGIAAVALMGVWLYSYTEAPQLERYYGFIVWHGHEMLFGYAVAVIAGFLLTAVRNWTDIDTPRGRTLAGLALLWLAGRVAPFALGILPRPVIALIDLAFLPMLTLALAGPLVRARQHHNLLFVPLLLTMAIANLLVHIQTWKGGTHLALTGLNLGIDLVAVLIVVMGGRVLPFFMERGLPGVRIAAQPRLDQAARWSVVALLVADLLGTQAGLTGAVALLAAVSNALRLAGWYHRRMWSVSLLWVLQAGYAWLVVGFALKALAATGLISPLLALHALTAGAIGVMTLGMMARVALGHTGRAMQAARATTLAFVVINVAAAVRVGLPLLSPAHYLGWIVASGALWIVAFSLFLVVYAPMLWRPRIDGRPG